ncbi:MAG: alcohol dehydrogenase-like regulatory protein ErcA [Sideroxyarcus sp.]|nr:alcohol dehydrogenase-like regulatory protein ErcA [Sideroxyarcus sp.]
MNPDTTLELRKFVVPEFVYGAGALNQIGRYARNFGAHKVLVVTDPGVVQAGWVEKALGSLNAENIPWVVFQDVTPNPKDDEVAAGVRFFRDNACDIIIAVGGGSPMDCAKGIGIAFANEKNVLEFEGVDEVQMPGPPLICVPTTAGSSADVSQFAIINDTNRKLKIAIISKTVVPDVALIDPETTTTMPAELTAATGLDALVHAMEAYVSNASSPITDLNALAAIPLLIGDIVPAIENPQDMKYRNNMMQGSLLAGLAFSNASLGLVHAMAHSLGGLLGLPHGMANALLLNHVVDFNYTSAPERYDRIGQAMGIEMNGTTAGKRKDALLNAIVTLRERTGIRTTIGALGVTREDIPQLSINAFNDPCLATNPRQASVQEIKRIYEMAL